MTADEAVSVLSNKKSGSYLLRFSQTPPYYALSVRHEQGVTHWRLEAKKANFQKPKFTLANKEFFSLQKLIETYKTLPLEAIKDGVSVPISALLHPLDRNVEKPNSHVLM
jgi:hypothetical protein